MKIRDIARENDKFVDMIESASGGSTSAGSIASVANPMGAVNHRPSLFGYIPVEEPKPRKKPRKRK